MGSLESRYANAAGVRVHYQEAGAGDPVICIHGAGPGANSASNRHHGNPGHRAIANLPAGSLFRR